MIVLSISLLVFMAFQTAMIYFAYKIGRDSRCDCQRPQVHCSSSTWMKSPLPEKTLNQFSGGINEKRPDPFDYETEKKEKPTASVPMNNEPVWYDEKQEYQNEKQLEEEANQKIEEGLRDLKNLNQNDK